MSSSRGENNSNYLENLPAELKVAILEFLDAEDLAVIERLSKKWQDFSKCHSNSLWKKILLKYDIQDKHKTSHLPSFYKYTTKTIYLLATDQFKKSFEDAFYNKDLSNKKIECCCLISKNYKMLDLNFQELKFIELILLKYQRVQDFLDFFNTLTEGIKAREQSSKQYLRLRIFLKPAADILTSTQEKLQAQEDPIKIINSIGRPNLHDSEVACLAKEVAYNYTRKSCRSNRFHPYIKLDAESRRNQLRNIYEFSLDRGSSLKFGIIFALLIVGLTVEPGLASIALFLFIKAIVDQLQRQNEPHVKLLNFIANMSERNDEIIQKPVDQNQFFQQQQRTIPAPPQDAHVLETNVSPALL